MPLQERTQTADILVTGANGALGRTLMELLGPNAAVAGTRRQNWGMDSFQKVLLADGDSIKALDWGKFRTVVNVAGRVHGDKKELEDANIHFPVNLALAARAGNVTQFVQVSSFSVYGLANHIDSNTRESPISDYGYTKAEGDRQLQALANESFRVTSLRLPFLFDADRPALFRPLFQAVKILPFLPIASEQTKRSMISYTDAAVALKAIVNGSRFGICHAAAPTVFDFAMLARLLLDEAGLRLRTVRLPNSMVGMIRIGAPAIHRRLFQSNVLSASLNIANEISEITDIEKPLRELVRKHFC